MNKLSVFSSVGTGISRFFSNVGFNTKKYSPEILMGLGVVSIVGGTILACKATLNATRVIQEHEDDVCTIAKAEEMSEEYRNGQERIHDITVAKTKFIAKMAMNYAPAVICIAGGIAMVCASHSIMRKRVAGLMAAYQAVDTAFRQYRERVVKEEGEVKDKHYLTGAEYELQKDPTTGEEHVVKVKEADPEEVSPKVYARFFDESSPYWKKDPWLNLTFLRSIQLQFNRKLQTRGHVFLNEVYEAIGIDEFPAGQILGWIQKEGAYIDLGIYDGADPAKRAFVNGYERSILINPNVQGVVYDSI